MAKALSVLGRVTAALFVLGAGGCSEEFTATTQGAGGSGAATSTDGGGGQGGSKTATPIGGSGGGQGGAGGGAAGAGGTGGSGGGEGGGPVCQPLSNPCTQCAYAACEALYCECYAEPDCAEFVDCIQPCGTTDIACQQPCLTAHEDSISKAFLLGNCAATPCEMECTGVGQVGPCPECLFTNCPTQMNECLANPDCFQLINCVQAGTDVFTCAGMYPGGLSEGLAVQDCMGQSCPMCP